MLESNGLLAYNLSAIRVTVAHAGPFQVLAFYQTDSAFIQMETLKYSSLLKIWFHATLKTSAAMEAT
jgi:hypothetical protein